MKNVICRRPSASMLVAITALVLGASGSAVAAGSLVSGDKVIKKHSLSGNRLRNHTVTGKQLNLSKLGKVPSAKTADQATTANTATNAATALNAVALGGQPSSAYDASSNFTRSGIIGAAVGASATVATFGPFTLTLTCTGTTTTPDAKIIASSSQPNSEANGMAPPDAGSLINVSGSSFNTNEFGGVDFISPSQGQFFGDVMAGVKYPGNSSPCIAMALINRS